MVISRCVYFVQLYTTYNIITPVRLVVFFVLNIQTIDLLSDSDQHFVGRIKQPRCRKTEYFTQSKTFFYLSPIGTSRIYCSRFVCGDNTLSQFYDTKPYLVSFFQHQQTTRWFPLY